MTHAPNPAECPGSESFPARRRGVSIEEKIMLGAGIIAASAVALTATPAPAAHGVRHVAYVASAAPVRRYAEPTRGHVVATPFRYTPDQPLCHRYQLGRFAVFITRTHAGPRGFVAQCRPVNAGVYAWESLQP